jgi:regulator of protease activity HflC (stomatin/prohibitin superfamily)
LLPDRPVPTGTDAVLSSGGVETIDGKQAARLDVMVRGERKGSVYLAASADDSGALEVLTDDRSPIAADARTLRGIARSVTELVRTGPLDVEEVRVPFGSSAALKVAFAEVGFEMTNRGGEAQAIVGGFHPIVKADWAHVRRADGNEGATPGLDLVEQVLATTPTLGWLDMTVSDGIIDHYVGKTIVGMSELTFDPKAGAPLPEAALAAMRDRASWNDTPAAEPSGEKERGAFREFLSDYKGIVAGVTAGAILVGGIGTWTIGDPKYKVDAGQVALIYEGGPFDGKGYVDTVDGPTGLKFKGLRDDVYTYPTTVRNYIVSLNPGEGDREVADSIKAPTSDGITVDYEVIVSFRLNTDLVRDFHEEFGLKYKAWGESEGWDDMLNDYMRNPLENALQRESRQVTSENLYRGDSAVLSDMQEAIAVQLKDNVAQLMGAEYFCGPTATEEGVACGDFEIVIKNATLPQTVRDGFEAQKTSSQKVVTAQNDAAAAEERAKGEANAERERAAGTKAAQEQLAGIYTDPNYIAWLEAQAQLECAKNPTGSCVLITGQGGTGVNVNVDGKPAG